MKKRDVEMMAIGAMLNQPEKPHTEYVTRTVIEKRAPTDDSIRLAKEYEEKAWSEVSSRVLVNVPDINVSYVVSEITLHDRSRHLFFKLNGKDIHCKIKDSYGLGMDEGIFKEIANKVTEKVMTELLKATLRKGSKP